MVRSMHIPLRLWNCTDFEHHKSDWYQQLGTPAYQSPEHIRAEKGITTSTDVYSFGVLLL